MGHGSRQQNDQLAVVLPERVRLSLFVTLPQLSELFSCRQSALKCRPDLEHATEESLEMVPVVTHGTEKRGEPDRNEQKLQTSEG